MAKVPAACKEFHMTFHGAKLAILVGDHVVSILRDDIEGLQHAGHWDLPGGAREDGETPETCVLRELHEELGLTLDASNLDHGFQCKAEDGTSWFFVSNQPDFDPSNVVFGNEGQGWKLVPVDWFLTKALAVPILQARLRRFLENGHPCP